MAIVSVSLDTATRKAVLTVNGVLIPSDEFNISQYKRYDDGKLELSFGYTIEHTDGDGLVERRHFYLPSSDEVDAGLDKDGFASRVLHDDEKAKADVIEFLKQGRSVPFKPLDK